ncbi:OB-fold domain-containing protein [Sporichthya sp.]|uniref:thiolase C-terminal domain-containing protein n=1 Tax=Sporichthya sp. TaxID=65475 RepID=UPI0025D1A7B0|nr:OB-fold domain-containing protein [Sporichthya sp.]
MSLPLPATDGAAGFFWTSGADGMLRLRYCSACSKHLHPALELCPVCFSDDLTVVQVSGHGHVVAVTVNEYPWSGVPGEPYAIVVVALADSPDVRLTSRLVGIAPDQAGVGLAVRVVFTPVEDVWLPLFEPSGLDPVEAHLPEPVVRIPSPASASRFEDAVALTGVGTSAVGRRLGRSELSLTIEACRAAVADAGLTFDDIDGLAAWPGSTGMPGIGSGGVRAVDQILGIRPTWHIGAQEVPGQFGGIITAMLAVSAGLCRHVLCWTAVSRDALPHDVNRGGRLTGEAQWRVPFGAISPAHWIALSASQYLHRYGASRDALGWVAVASGRHATNNPLALRSECADLDAYYAGKTITTPFGIFDCDVTCDGAYAVVVSAVDAARDCAHPVVRVAAAGTAIGEAQSWDQDTLTHQPNLFGQAAHLWTRTSLTPEDVDVACLYDGFSFNALSWLEALGFCGLGEGADFVKDAERIGPGGSLPVNPHGGQLSAGRSNGFGFLIEAVTQLRGQAGARQVPGAEVAVVSAGGGIPAGCLLLTTER